MEMSAETQSTTDAQPETTTKKTVSIMAYGANEGASNRMFAQAIDQSTDFTERRTRTTDTCKIHFTNRWGDDSDTKIDREAYLALAGDDAGEPEDGEDFSETLEVNEGTLTREIEHSEEYRYGPRTGASNLLDEASDALPSEITGGHTESTWGTKYQNDEDVTKVRVSSRGISKKKVLVHQSERDSSEDMFEGDTEYPAAEYSVTLEGTPEEVEAWSEEVISPLLTALATADGVHKVRVTDCKETVEKEGDCFNL